MEWIGNNFQYIAPIVVGLLALFVGGRILVRKEKQTQRGGNKSRNLQAGRDINIGKADKE